MRPEPGESRFFGVQDEVIEVDYLIGSGDTDVGGVGNRDGGFRGLHA